jgi:hypothetical protein
MTEPPPDFREEIDIVQIDPLLLERQRNRYASRGIALLILLNGIAALILLAGFSNLAPATQNAGKVVMRCWFLAPEPWSGLPVCFLRISGGPFALWRPSGSP